MAERVTYKSPTFACARCCDCDWTLDSKNAIGVAAKHSDKYDHWVDVDISSSVSFRRVGKDYYEKRSEK
jgi:hypothetical protein